MQLNDKLPLNDRPLALLEWCISWIKCCCSLGVFDNRLYIVGDCVKDCLVFQHWRWDVLFHCSLFNMCWITQLKRTGDSGSSCFTPLLICTSGHSLVFVVQFLYSCMYFSCTPQALSDLHMKWCCTNQFQQSRSLCWNSSEPSKVFSKWLWSILRYLPECYQVNASLLWGIDMFFTIF